MPRPLRDLAYLDWTDLGNGHWASPGGRIYREESGIVQRVIEARARVRQWVADDAR